MFTYGENGRRKLRVRGLKLALLMLLATGLAVVGGSLAWASDSVSFAPAQNYPAGIQPQQLTSADLNGDSTPDLAVTNAQSDNVSALLGSGDGTFQVAQNFSVGDFPFGIVSADFNSDGRLDLAVANNFSSDVSVLLGNGGGTFQGAQNFSSGGNGPTGIISADLNGDGRLSTNRLIPRGVRCGRLLQVLS
jgi:hypothetical protein